MLQCYIFGVNPLVPRQLIQIAGYALFRPPVLFPAHKSGENGVKGRLERPLCRPGEETHLCSPGGEAFMQVFGRGLYAVFGPPSVSMA